MKEQGIALITVLILIATMAALVATGQKYWRKTLQQTQNVNQQMQLRWTLVGAEQWLLRQPPAMAEGKTSTLSMEGVMVNYQWRDRQACFNLNSLINHAGSNRLTNAQHIFATLLRLQGVDDATRERAMTAVLHHLNTVSNPTRRPVLDDKSEIRTVIGIDEAHWETLSSQLCALPSSRLQININALNRDRLPLLIAMLGGRYDEATVNRILERRPAQGWNSIDEFINALPEDGRSLASTLQSVAVTKSLFRELWIWSAVENNTVFEAIRTQLQWDDDRLQVLYRLYGVSESP